MNFLDITISEIYAQQTMHQNDTFADEIDAEVDKLKTTTTCLKQLLQALRNMSFESSSPSGASHDMANVIKALSMLCSRGRGLPEQEGHFCLPRMGQFVQSIGITS